MHYKIDDGTCMPGHLTQSRAQAVAFEVCRSKIQAPIYKAVWHVADEQRQPLGHEQLARARRSPG